MNTTTDPDQEIGRWTDDGTYHLRHDWDGRTELGTTLFLALQAISDDAAGREPLYRSVDPDALDSLFAPASTDVDRRQGELSFRCDGCSITVRATGDVVIDPDSPPGTAEEGTADV
jgi:hypothetical protein